MPRKREVPKRKPQPDPKYGDVTIAKFINMLMRRGKRSLAEGIFYGAMEIVEKKTSESGMKMFKRALENVKPQLEAESRRVGGSTYQVPVEVRAERKQSLAMRWLINYSKARNEKSMRQKLAAEVLDAAAGKGASIKKREDTHRMAEANKAFAHYRW